MKKNVYHDKEVEEGLESPIQESGTGAPAVPESRRGKVTVRSLTRVLFRRHLGLILLICIYVLLLVGNRYWVEGLMKQKNARQRDIEFLKEDRVLRQKEYQQSVRITRIADVLDTVGVKFISGPPFEIER